MFNNKNINNKRLGIFKIYNNPSIMWLFFQLYNFLAIFAIIYITIILSLYGSSYTEMLRIINSNLHLTLLIISLIILIKASYFWTKEIVSDYIDKGILKKIIIFLYITLLIIIMFAGIISLLIIKI